MSIVRQNSDYALRAMINLAKRYGDKPISTKQLAEEEGITYHFASKIMQKLQHAKLVKSQMGPKGGVSLNLPPAEISLLDVIGVVQGKLNVNKCLLGPDGCSRKCMCPISGKLAELQDYMESFLDGITLDEFLDEGVAK